MLSETQVAKKQNRKKTPDLIKNKKNTNNIFYKNKLMIQINIIPKEKEKSSKNNYLPIHLYSLVVSSPWYTYVKLKIKIDGVKLIENFMQTLEFTYLDVVFHKPSSSCL